MESLRVVGNAQDERFSFRAYGVNVHFGGRLQRSSWLSGVESKSAARVEWARDRAPLV